MLNCCGGFLQALKRKERDYEHEMERLARDKISLQQRLSTLKKDMLGKWDHLDWRSMIPDDLDVDLDMDGGNELPSHNRNGSGSHENHRVLNEDTNGCLDLKALPKNGTVLKKEMDESQRPLPLIVKACPRIGK